MTGPVDHEGGGTPRGHDTTVPAPRRPLHEDAYGPYRILETLGEGGFGIVFRAERREPMVQEVALKVLRPEAHHPSLADRFSGELQALAALDHPNIARVYDGGISAGGRPWFAMELIRGERLDQYIARRHPPLSERLKLFIAIARGVAHAHAHGLVHRDIKPGNILVSEHDRSPVPRIIDFGVAKALHPGAPARTLAGDTIGTPEYMSPEQAGSPLGQVDARSDIYSLGVLLFEMLTGQMPLDVTRIRSTPVGRLSQVLAALPARRAGDVDPALKGDLETIIARAMHKERDRRYASAAELADEVQRFIEGRPILARRDSAAYVGVSRLRRAWGRYPAVGAGAAVLAVVMLVHNVLAPWVIRPRPVQVAFEELLTRTANTLAPVPLTRTVNVAPTEETTPQSLASAAGLQGVSNASTRSERLVHAAMLKRLAGAQPAGVVIDISFKAGNGPDYDAEIADGLRTLDQAGVPWAALVMPWPITIEPNLVSSILNDDRTPYAMSMIACGPRFIQVALGVQHAGKIYPSLVTRAYALIRHPRSTLDLSTDREARSLLLACTPLPARGAAGHAPPAPESLPLSMVQPADGNGDDLGIAPNDEVLLFDLRLPTYEALSAATMSYEQVLTAPDELLRRWFAGKVIVLSNNRLSARDFETINGRTVYRGQIVAAGLDAMLEGRTARVLDGFDQTLALMGAAGVGAAIGRTVRSSVRRMAALGLVGAAICGASALGYTYLAVLLHPLPLFIGVVLTSELASVLAPSPLLAANTD